MNPPFRVPTRTFTLDGLLMGSPLSKLAAPDYHAGLAHGCAVSDYIAHLFRSKLKEWTGASPGPDCYIRRGSLAVPLALKMANRSARKAPFAAVCVSGVILACLLAPLAARAAPQG